MATCTLSEAMAAILLRYKYIDMKDLRPFCPEEGDDQRRESGQCSR
jgi:hypothetical protein